ncbi:MAG TPA: hypothetical protein ENI80_05435 [Acidiferrobacteraceae bacterium]|nr:hypothetical protein [Acidiferrobacteraceae bacterium]
MDRKILFRLLAVLLLSIVTSNFIYASENCQKFPPPSNYKPSHNAYRLNMNPELKVAIQTGTLESGPCKWQKTYWQVVSDREHFKHLNFPAGIELDFKKIKTRRDKIQKYIVFSATTKGRFKGRLKIPNSLKPGREYWWRAALSYALPAHTSGSPLTGHIPQYTAYSKPTLFTTTFVKNGKCIAMPTPYIGEPHSGITTSITPTLKILDNTNPGVGVDSPCILAQVEWQVANRSTFKAQEIIASGSTSPKESNGAHYVYKVPPGTLKKSSTTYYWRARVIGKQARGSTVKIFSPWTSPANFRSPNFKPLTMRTCPGLNAPIHTQPADGSRVSLSPNLKVATRGLSPGCSWDQTAWQILDATNGDYIHQTGFTGERYSITVPAGKLKPGHKYIWRTKIKALGKGPGRSDVTSGWSLETRFSTQ